MSPHFPVLLLALGLTVAAPGDFIAPDLRQALFQKDRIPLDPDRMRELAGQLGHLTAQETGDSAAHARARAQLLTLASRLDPANPGIRAALGSLEKGTPPARPPAQDVERAEATVWRIVAWLQQEEAGAEGRHLAALLLDPLRVLYPKHPAVQNHDPAAEASRWDGVVAPVEEFAPAGPPEAMVPEPPSPDPPELGPTPVPEPWTPPITLRENRLHTPL